ncbi:MAG: YggT family protein [Cyanobacteria bacterium J06641_5]
MTLELLRATITNFFFIYSTLLFIRIILTWFQSQNWAQQAIYVLSPITDPYLNLFRSIIPPLGGLDLSPMLAFFALSFVRSLLLGII